MQVITVLLVFWRAAFLLHAAPVAPGAQQQSPLRIAAAADLQPVLPALLLGFERATGKHAEASFASSATLATQIENGAPFDLFLSADLSLPEKLMREGLTAIRQPVQPYARGTLVLWTRNGSHVGPLSMSLLGTPSVHSIAIANPDHAPYGRASRQALSTFGLWGNVQSKLRTAENIAQAAQFASTGNAEVGLLSLNSALTLRAQGTYVPVPVSSYTPIVQGAVALRRSTRTQDAVAFLHYLRTPATGEQLRQGGLEPIPESAAAAVQTMRKPQTGRLP